MYLLMLLVAVNVQLQVTGCLVSNE